MQVYLLNVGVLKCVAFKSVQREVSHDSFSSNNIKERCEMISNSVCCLSLSSVSISQHLITRMMLGCLENVTKTQRKELKERKTEQWNHGFLKCEEKSYEGDSLGFSWGILGETQDNRILHFESHTHHLSHLGFILPVFLLVRFILAVIGVYNVC